MSNSITVNALWNVFARIVPLAITFFLTPYMVKCLGITHYGLYMLVISVSGLMGIMSFGLGDATLRFVAHYYNLNDMAGVNRVIRSTLLVYLVIGFLTVLLAIILAPYIIGLFAIGLEDKGLATTLLRYTSLGFFFTLMNSVVSAIPQALQRYDINTRVVIAVAILQAAGSLLLLLYGYGIIALIWLGIGGQCFSFLLNYLVARRLLPSAKIIPGFSRAGLREVFGYGIFSFLSQAFGMSFSYSDRLLTGAFISAGSVGFLTVPQDLAFRALSLVSQGAAVLFPRFTVVESLQDRSRLYLQASWAMLFLSSIIFVPLTVFMTDFIGLWINPEFAVMCSHVGQLIAMSSIVRGAFVVYESLFKGINKPQYVTILSFFVGATSLGLNLWLIPRFGLSGAGYSYCFTALLGVVTVILTWRYVLQNSTWKPLVQSLLFPTLLAFTCLVIGLWFRSLFPPVGWIALIVEGGLIFTMTAGVLLGFDVLTGGPESGANVFLRGIKRNLRLRLRVA